MIICTTWECLRNFTQDRRTRSNGKTRGQPGRGCTGDLAHSPEEKPKGGREKGRLLHRGHADRPKAIRRWLPTLVRWRAGSLRLEEPSDFRREELDTSKFCRRRRGGDRSRSRRARLR